MGKSEAADSPARMLVSNALGLAKPAEPKKRGAAGAPLQVRRDVAGAAKGPAAVEEISEEAICFRRTQAPRERWQGGDRWADASLAGGSAEGRVSCMIISRVWPFGPEIAH